MTKENLSDWRKRKISGLMVPCDTQVVMPEAVTDKRIHDWLLSSDIEFFERVHGENSRDHDFVMVVDDEGRDRGLPWNPRAQFLSGYPIHAPIVGNAIFCSEGWTGEGVDFINLSPQAQTWLLDPQRMEDYRTWWKTDEVRDYAKEYFMRYPQKSPAYPHRDTAPTGTVDWSKSNLNPDPLKD